MDRVRVFSEKFLWLLLQTKTIYQDLDKALLIIHHSGALGNGLFYFCEGYKRIRSVLKETYMALTFAKCLMLSTI